MRLMKLLFALFALILISCECPYQDELDRAQQRKIQAMRSMLMCYWEPGSVIIP